MSRGGDTSRSATRSVDDGLVAFATVLAMHRIAVDPDQLRHAVGHHDAVSADELLRLAKRQDGVRAKLITTTFANLSRLPLPALAAGPEGWFVLGRVTDDAALVQRPGCSPERLDQPELDAAWSGRLILITTREGVTGAAGRFDVT